MAATLHGIINKMSCALLKTIKSRHVSRQTVATRLAGHTCSRQNFLRRTVRILNDYHDVFA
jgi:hypothetical protein